MWLNSLTQAKCSLVPRPVRAIRVTRGGLEASAIVQIFPTSLTGDVISEIPKDDWEQGWAKCTGLTCLQSMWGERKSIPGLALHFQPCSRPFVRLLEGTWICKNTDCFAVYFFYWQTRVYFYRIDGVEFWTLAQRRPFFQQPICMPGCKLESQFYSLPLGQWVASMY